MRTDDLFDLLGEIDDKYYMEALTEVQEPTARSCTKRTRLSFVRIAASLAVITGLAASLVILNGRGFFDGISENTSDNTEGTETTLSSDTADDTPLYTIPVEDLYSNVFPNNSCVKPTYKQITDSINYFLDNQKDFSEQGVLTPEQINCYTNDLNFDGVYEIILVSWDGSDIFIFELNEDTAVLNTVLSKTYADFELNKDNFSSMRPYGNQAEEYYYLYSGTKYSSAKNSDDFTHTVAAIKYDKNKEIGNYSAESVVSYSGNSGGGKLSDIRYAVNGIELEDTEENEEKVRGIYGKYEYLPLVVFPSDLDECREYIRENYDSLVPLAQHGYFSEPDFENLSFYFKDLDFDNYDEVIVVDWENTPLFVFDFYAGGMVFNSVVGNDKIRAYITKENFEAIAPFTDGESGERYWYYWYWWDDPMWEKCKLIKAIKHDSEHDSYYTESVLDYGLNRENLNDPWEIYFIKTVPVNGDRYNPKEYLSYEEFCALWNKHTELPPVSFEDFDDMDTILENEGIIYEGKIINDLAEITS